MRIRISRGSIQIPVKIFFVGLVISFLVMLVCVPKITWQESRCRKLPPNKPSLPRTHRAHHPGCSRDPDYVTYNYCPDCFRASVKEISEKLTLVDTGVRTIPRGTPHFFAPKDTPQQELVSDVLIAPWSVCADTCPYMVAVQLSLAHMAKERNLVRATWASVAKTHVWPHSQVNADFKIIFVIAREISNRTTSEGPPGGRTKNFHQGGTPEHPAVGSPKRTPSLWSRVTAEADKFGDILFLGMDDSYYNLTLKVLSGFLWVSNHCRGSKFILKVDTDTFVHLPLLLDLLIHNEHRLNYSIVGHVYERANVVMRSDRWAVGQDVYPIAMYPAYTAGCAYIVSMNALNMIVALAPYVPMVPIEDAHVTGIMAHEVKAELYTHRELFTYFEDDSWQRCDVLWDAKVVGTLSGGDRALDIWSALLVNNKTCVGDYVWNATDRFYPLLSGYS